MKRMTYVIIFLLPVMSTIIAGCKLTDPYGGGSSRAYIYHIGEIETPGHAYSVAVSGNKAYVASGAGGLRVIDTITPHFPIETDNYESFGVVWDVAIYGDFAYIASDDEGLEIIDINSPFGAEKVGSYKTDSAFGLDRAGNYVYLADGMGGVRIIDVSTAHDPYETGRLNVSGQIAYSAKVVWPFLYVGSRHGLSIINVENVHSPYEVHYESITDVYDISISGNIAYIAYDGGLRLYDISDARDPVFLNEKILHAPARSVFVRGEFAYLALGAQGITVIRISNPSELYEVAWYRPAGSIINNIKLAGRYIFAADGIRGLLILEFSISQ